MRRPTRAFVLFVVTALLLAAAVLAVAAVRQAPDGGFNPDVAPIAPEMDSEAYLRARGEQIGFLRGIDPVGFTNPRWRAAAVEARLEQEARQRRESPNAPTAAWIPIGPNTVADGQGQTGTTAVSGRATAIAIDPTNSNKVYLGTAQGGVWRSLNGGTTWTSIFDTAQSQAIGALAIAPSSPTTLYVGTGEDHQSADSFFGVGLYRIDNADTSANLVGPINPSMTFTCEPTVCTGSFTTNAFTGRAISKILVHPTNAATIFVSTSSGISGLGASGLSSTIPPLALRGVYRSTNATSAAGSVTFQKLAVVTATTPVGVSFDSPPTGNRSITDMVFVNGDPNTLVASSFGNAAANDGGIFRSTNALAATPTFTQTFTASIQRIAFAGLGNTLFAATSESTGLLRQSTDGGVTWPTTLPAANGFCGGQCFYDIVVGVDPDSVSPNFRIYLGGSAGAGPASAMRLSTNGGASFATDQTGLHADTHVIEFDALTNPNTVYTGDDGGVWKRDSSLAAGSGWTNLNNSLGTLQFQSIAVGRSDAFFTIGGTQDNGTNKELTSLGNWDHADFGDGGFALIDQSTTSTTNVTMYHTYFNSTGSLIGFARTGLTSCANDGTWATRGFGFGTNPAPSCDGTPTAAGNGITGTDSVLFYAPMALGPGTPNTLYFGTDRLYRSTNQGDTMSVVSQAPIVSGAPNPNIPISAIGISPQNDNVRIVGLRNGTVWATTTGSSTLTNVTSGSFPANPASTTNRFVGRAVIDPNNTNTAYVTFSFYAPAGQGVWKTTNLSSPTPTWTAAGTGIPSIPVNAFVVDPNDSNDLYAGTDVGVYQSTDGGANWTVFGTGLPASAVFDMTIVQPGTATEKLRIATHGRSMWEMALTGPTSVSVASFAARRIGPNVVLSWRTASESRINGFNLFRNGKKLNRGLIVAKHSGQARGAAYRFVDRAGGRSAKYRLQLVDLKGNRSWHDAPAGIAR